MKPSELLLEIGKRHGFNAIVILILLGIGTRYGGRIVDAHINYLERTAEATERTAAAQEQTADVQESQAKNLDQLADLMKASLAAEKNTAAQLQLMREGL